MVERLAQKVSYWILVFLTVSVVVLGYYRYKQETTFQNTGSRFTGEDAIWLLQHSNIILTPDAKIDGQATPFRDYINIPTRGHYMLSDPLEETREKKKK